MGFGQWAGDYTQHTGTGAKTLSILLGLAAGVSLATHGAVGMLSGCPWWVG